MRILKLDPGSQPIIMEIEDSLEAMQAIVNGHIQAIYPFKDAIALICNEEGKILGSPYNRTLRADDTGQIHDIICGTCFLCGAPPDSDSFTGLTDEQLSKYPEYYSEPELFLAVNNRVVVLK